MMKEDDAVVSIFKSLELKILLIDSRKQNFCDSFKSGDICYAFIKRHDVNTLRAISHSLFKISPL